MAAKRKFLVRWKIDGVDPMEVEADRFDVADGALVFSTNGFLVLALAPALWERCELVPPPGERPERPRT